MCEQIKIARTLDSLAVETARHRHDETVPASYLDLVQQAVDGLQSDNTRLYQELTSLRQNIINLLETLRG